MLRENSVPQKFLTRINRIEVDHKREKQTLGPHQHIPTIAFIHYKNVSHTI